MSINISQMSLEEFKAYVSNSGVNFDGLSPNEKREWRETFDKSRQLTTSSTPAGKFITKSHSISLTKI
jgi:hypothetical protein